MDDRAKASANNLITFGTFEFSCPIITGLFLQTILMKKSEKKIQIATLTIQSNHIDNRRHRVFLQYLHESEAKITKLDEAKKQKFQFHDSSLEQLILLYRYYQYMNYCI